MTEPHHHLSDHDEAHVKGLRSIATIEITKGILVILAAFALIVMLRRNVDLEDIAYNILNFLHIDPDRRFASWFINAAGHAEDMQAKMVAVGAGVYSGLRFIEGYGLWNTRIWAEWMALISGSIYLPPEIIALVRHPSWLHWTFLITNILILAYIAWVRFCEDRYCRTRKSRVRRNPVTPLDYSG